MAKEDTQWKPGQSGNPGGRPKGHSITAVVNEMFDANPELKRQLGGKIMDLALKGDLNAMKLLWNYIDGMPKQSTDITTGGDKISGPIYYPTEGESKE